MSYSKIFLKIPSQSCPPRMQTITGKPSLISPDVEEYRGMPYANIPGRWQHSTLRSELPSDNFDATHNGPKCTQPSGPNNSDTFQAHLDFPSDVTESEFDCLNLCIQRPSQNALRRIGKENALLPVFVWIHGGGFGFGAATDPMWNPTRLVMQSISLGTPIIVASINYRLNIFGFLASSSLLSSNAQGLNFGLQDQNQALRWVALNIPSFGGDASKITVAGQSAGGASVHAHVLNARTSSETPLFRRAVLMSGSIEVLGPRSMAEMEVKWDALSEKLGVTGSAVQRMEKMERIPTQELVDASWNLGWLGFDNVIDEISISAPADADSEFVVSFDTTEARESANGDKGRIDVLIGETTSEGSLWMNAALPNLTSFPQISSIFHSTYPSPTAASTILAAYNITLSSTLASLHESIVRFATDTMMSLANTRAVHHLRQQTQGSLSTTVQEYTTRYGNPFPGPSFGIAHHCVDLIYFFDAFHDYLAAADEKETAHEDGAYVAARSNADLTLQVQTDFLRFITDETLDEETGSEDIRVYGHDRSVQDQSLGDAYWAEQRSRLEVLGRDWKSARETLAALMSAK